MDRCVMIAAMCRYFVSLQVFSMVAVTWRTSKNCKTVKTGGGCLCRDGHLPGIIRYIVNLLSS